MSDSDGVGPVPVSSAADSIAVGPSQAGDPSRLRSTLRAVAFVALCLGSGVIAGGVWHAMVKLPVYTVGSDGGANTTERGLTEFFGGDGWFVLIGAVLCLILGVIGWRRLAHLGWPLVLLVLFAALAAALTCWMVGYRLGPGNFTERLAAARAGDLVPIELTLRARASLLTWPFFAVIPVLLGSSLGRDDEDPQRSRRRGAPARRS